MDKPRPMRRVKDTKSSAPIPGRRRFKDAKSSGPFPGRRRLKIAKSSVPFDSYEPERDEPESDYIDEKIWNAIQMDKPRPMRRVKDTKSSAPIPGRRRSKDAKSSAAFDSYDPERNEP